MSLMAYTIVIDQSTTSSKAFLIDPAGTICDSQQKEHTKYYPQEGYAEHDAEEIYQNVLHCVQQLIERNPLLPVERLSITNQRETVVAWDKTTGKPITRAIVWQCSRTHDRCTELIRAGWEPLVQEKTGLKIDPYFSATKMEWILDHVACDPDSLLFGTIDSWLVWKLSGGTVHATDHTNASRTLLYNLKTNTWDEELLALFHIPEASLPEIRDSDAQFGLSDLDGLLEQPVEIRGVMGDSQAAFYGQQCVEEGDIKMTLGTGSSIMMNVQHLETQSNGLVNVLGYSLQDQKAWGLEGIVNCNGECLNWAKDDLHLFDSYAELDEELLGRKSSVLFVPALTGLSMPYWNSQARGLFLGLDRSSNQQDMLKALIDGVVYQLCDALNSFEKASSLVHVDGGLSKNEWIMQRLADLSGKQIEVAVHEDLSAMGAWLAGSQKKSFPKEVRLYVPQMPEAQRAREMNRYHRAIDCALMMATIDNNERKWETWNTLAV